MKTIKIFTQAVLIMVCAFHVAFEVLTVGTDLTLPAECKGKGEKHTTHCGEVSPDVPLGIAWLAGLLTAVVAFPLFGEYQRRTGPQRDPAKRSPCSICVLVTNCVLVWACAAFLVIYPVAMTPRSYKMFFVRVNVQSVGLYMSMWLYPICVGITGACTACCGSRRQGSPAKASAKALAGAEDPEELLLGHEARVPIRQRAHWFFSYVLLPFTWCSWGSALLDRHVPRGMAPFFLVDVRKGSQTCLLTKLLRGALPSLVALSWFLFFLEMFHILDGMHKSLLVLPFMLVIGAGLVAAAMDDGDVDFLHNATDEAMREVAATCKEPLALDKPGPLDIEKRGKSLSDEYKRALESGQVLPEVLARELVTGFVEPEPGLLALIGEIMHWLFYIVLMLLPLLQGIVSISAMPKTWHDVLSYAETIDVFKTKWGAFSYVVYVLAITLPQAGLQMLTGACRSVHAETRRLCDGERALLSMLDPGREGKDLVPKVDYTDPKDLLVWVRLSALVEARDPRAIAAETGVGYLVFLVAAYLTQALYVLYRSDAAHVKKDAFFLSLAVVVVVYSNLQLLWVICAGLTVTAERKQRKRVFWKLLSKLNTNIWETALTEDKEGLKALKQARDILERYLQELTRPSFQFSILGVGMEVGRLRALAAVLWAPLSIAVPRLLRTYAQLLSL